MHVVESMTVGELRAVLEGVRDEARLLIEAMDTASWGMQFAVLRAYDIGASTDDPGVVFKVVRTR